MVQPETVEQAQLAAEGAAGAFNPGEVILGHVSNGPHPLIHLPTIYGVDFSVTKHVLMLWIVAAIVFFVITTPRRSTARARTSARSIAPSSSTTPMNRSTSPRR